MTRSVLLMPLLAACATPVPLAPDSVDSDADLYSLQLTPTPDPPTSGDNVLDVELLDADGAAVTGATLTVNPWMTDMGHGIGYEPEALEAADGVYTLEWSYPMGGYWEVSFAIDGPPGPDTAVVAYDVQ